MEIVWSYEGKKYGGVDKDALLADVVTLIQSGQCDSAAGSLLEQFGYMQNGDICVPVYISGHRRYIAEIEGAVEQCLGEEMSEMLIEFAGSIDITAVRHGVNQLEIANELYHIMFGLLNEELAMRKIVAAPQQILGEGRCFMARLFANCICLCICNL